MGIKYTNSPKGKGKGSVNGTPSHSYGVSFAIQDYTVFQTDRYSVYLPQRDGRLS